VTVVKHPKRRQLNMISPQARAPLQTSCLRVFTTVYTETVECYNALMTYLAAGWLSMCRYLTARSAHTRLHCVSLVLFLYKLRVLMMLKFIQAEADYLRTP
jgi:hypothetical protein